MCDEKPCFGRRFLPTLGLCDLECFSATGWLGLVDDAGLPVLLAERDDMNLGASAGFRCHTSAGHAESGGASSGKPSLDNAFFSTALRRLSALRWQRFFFPSSETPQ